MSITPHMSFPRIQPFAAAEQPHGQARLPEGLSFAPSHPVWMGEGVKPQLPAPLPCSGGFIEGDLLLKPRPESPSVCSSLPETGISFTAPRPRQSCRCEIEPVVPGAAPWRGWSSPLASRQGRVYFKVMGALCKQSPSAGQTPHPAPKPGGFVKPESGVSCC